MTIPVPDRPQPLQTVAADAVRVQGLWVGLSTALVSAGLVSYAANNLITALFGLIPGVLALVGTMLGARAVAINGTPLVTPVSDPQDHLGRPLLPAPPVLPMDYQRKDGST
jgi:hypothetical protein